MNKLKNMFSVFFIFFFLTKASARIVSFFKPESSLSLNEIMGNIMRLCYFDLKYIIIFTDSESYVENHLRFVQPVAIVLQHYSSHQLPKCIHRHPIDVMIVDLHSIQQLKDILVVDFRPLLWTQSTSLFIVDKTSKGCKNVHDVFKTTWSITISIAFFLCIDSNQKPTLYTYNPYANFAPDSWNEVRETHGNHEPETTWTLYQRFYDPENIYEGFQFDRTKVLHGAKINIAAKIIDKDRHRSPNFIYNENYTESLAYPGVHIAKALKHAMNASLTFNYNLNIHQKGYDVYKQLRNATFDIILSSHHITEGIKHSIAYPIEYIEYYIFTNDQGHFTLLDKLCSCLVLIITLIIIFILSMTVIVILIFKPKVTIASTLFEVYKLIVNVPLRLEINSVGLKIFFSLIFFYFLVFKIRLNGNFMSHFINYGIKKNVEILEDLEDPNYNTIYVSNDMYSLLKNSSLKNKVVLGTPYCEEQIKNSRSVACLDKIDVFSKSSVSKELHIAQSSVTGDYYVYLTRKNWPLKARLNLFMMRIQQSGLSKLWFRELDLDRAINMHRYTEQILQKFHITTLGDLKFLLIILIVGWTFAAISFTLEKLL